MPTLFLLSSAEALKFFPKRPNQIWNSHLSRKSSLVSHQQVIHQQMHGRRIQVAYILQHNEMVFKEDPLFQKLLKLSPLKNY